MAPYAHALRRLPSFLQQLEMESNGKRTTRDGAPAHTESGYLRFVDEVGTVEIVASLPTGQTELGTGSVLVEGDVLTLVTEAAVQSTPTATQVTRLVRTFTLSGDTLDYRLDMDWAGGSQERHLSSTMTRVQACGEKYSCATQFTISAQKAAVIATRVDDPIVRAAE